MLRKKEAKKPKHDDMKFSVYVALPNLQYYEVL